MSIFLHWATNVALIVAYLAIILTLLVLWLAPIWAGVFFHVKPHFLIIAGLIIYGATIGVIAWIML